MAVSTKKIIQGHVQSIAFGGDGIIRHQGQVVFVPFAAPGDEMDVQITLNKKSFARGKIANLITQSPDRVVPPCQYFGQCGGCQLQHLNYDRQLSVKKTFVMDALNRIGKLESHVDEVRGAAIKWEYRRHIRLHWQNGRLGFVRQDLQGLVEIKQCLIFDDRAEIFQKIRHICVSLNLKTSAEISIYKAGDGLFVLFFEFPVPAIHGHKIFQDALVNNTEIKGIMWRADKKYNDIGDCNIKFNLDGLNLTHNPKVFVQAHPEQSAALYLKLRDLVKEVSARRVLDLYCGMGATSLLFKREGLEVLAIEANPESIDLADKNEAANGLSGTLWHLADVDELIPKIIKEFGPDCVVVNPPRTGLSDVAKMALLDFAPKNIFYISCMPATLARDLAFFTDAYRLVHCQPYDMFPGTTHVETLVHLLKR